jgi:enoyl-CoA hydratase/carnithine racemase
MEMLLLGRFITADEAERFGLVNRIVAPDRLAEQTRNWALEMAQCSRYTLAFGKEAFYKQVDLADKSAYNFATNAMVMNCLAEDAQEGMLAFLEKREPVWKDR